MGVENYLITSSLVAVLAQRLVRVICKHCKQPAKRGLNPQGEMVPTFLGRGIFELMELNDDIRQPHHKP